MDNIVFLPIAQEGKHGLDEYSRVVVEEVEFESGLNFNRTMTS